MLLNHFVKGRLYDRDLKDDEVFETVGGSPIKISRKQPGIVTVNQAKILETEIFVYNLGTMFYVDDVLYHDLLQEDVKAATEPPLSNKRENDSGEDAYTTEITIFNENEEKLSTSKFSTMKSYLAALLTTRSDVEIVPSEFTELSGNDEDFLLQDDEIIPPKALPSRLNMFSPKK